jgi:menaquinone-dependent protoporphyrinogen IX oxidase
MMNTEGFHSMLMSADNSEGGAVVKVLVAYMSKTGNTKKVAEAIFEEIRDEKEIRPIDEVDSVEGYDVAFLGFPIHMEGPDKKAARLLEKHCISGRNVVLFITHAAPEDSQDLPPALEKFRKAARHANIVDMFDCQGQLDKTTKRIMSILPDDKLRLCAKLDNSQGQPDKTRLDRARAFSRNVMERLHDLRIEPIGESRRGNMNIEYFHASKYGNGARVAEEFKNQMADKGITVNVHHVREAKPKEMPPADLYVFSSPGRFGKPIGDMRRFLKEARLPSGTKCAILTTELAPAPDKKTGKMPTEEELGKCQRMIPVMNQMLQEKNFVSVAQCRILVTGLKGPLEEGWQKKVGAFASQIPSSPDAPAEERPARSLVMSLA